MHPNTWGVNFCVGCYYSIGEGLNSDRMGTYLPLGVGGNSQILKLVGFNPTLWFARSLKVSQPLER